MTPNEIRRRRRRTENGQAPEVELEPRPESVTVADLRAELAAVYETNAALEAELDLAWAEVWHWRIREGTTQIEFMNYRNQWREWAALRMAKNHAKARAQSGGGPGAN